MGTFILVVRDNYFAIGNATFVWPQHRYAMIFAVASLSSQ